MFIKKVVGCFLIDENLIERCSGKVGRGSREKLRRCRRKVMHDATDAGKWLCQTLPPPAQKKK